MNREIGAGSLRVRRVMVGLAAVVLASASLLALSSGARGARSHAAAHSSSSTIHVIEHAVTDTTVNSGGKGDRTGNLLTFHNKVFNAKDTKQVGRDQGFCTRIVPGQSYECLWTTFLSGGQITVEGPFFDHANSVLAITGGTGRFHESRGEMNLISRHGGTEFDFVFHLTS